MKKLLTLALSLLMVFGLTGCTTEEKDALDRIKEQGYIVLGTSPDYAPSEFYIKDDKTGDKKIVGSDIALAQAIADKIGVELQILESDFNTVILNAQAGTVDMGISGFAWKQDRAEVVDFSVDYSRVAGDESWQGFMIRREDIAKYPTKEAFKAAGGTVGAQAASIQVNMAYLVADKENIVELLSTTDCAAQLNSGDLDGFVCTSNQAEQLMITYPGIVLLPEETFDMDPNDEFNKTGVIFSKDPSYDTLEALINEVIEEAKVVNPETGKSMLDVWYDEAVALQPGDLTDQIDWDTIYDK